MPLEAGVRLGPYQIVAPLGAGGMGEVYRARDTKLHRDLAITRRRAASQEKGAGPRVMLIQNWPAEFADRGAAK